MTSQDTGGLLIFTPYDLHGELGPEDRLLEGNPGNLGTTVLEDRYRSESRGFKLCEHLARRIELVFQNADQLVGALVRPRAL